MRGARANAKPARCHRPRPDRSARWPCAHSAGFGISGSLPDCRSAPRRCGPPRRTAAGSGRRDCQAYRSNIGHALPWRRTSPMIAALRVIASPISPSLFDKSPGDPQPHRRIRSKFGPAAQSVFERSGRRFTSRKSVKANSSRQPHLRQCFHMMLRRLRVEAAKHDARDGRRVVPQVRKQPCRLRSGPRGRAETHRPRSRSQGRRDWRAGAARERQRIAVAGSEQRVLVAIAAAPDRADGMDHMPRLQQIAAR